VNDAPLSKEQLQEMLTHSNFIKFLQLEVLTANAEKQEVAMRLQMRPEFERGHRTGQWHGGPIAAAIDTVGDYALTMLVGIPLPTINFRVDYLRPAVNTALTVIARVRRSGRTVGIVDVDVLNDSGTVVALGRANYSTFTS
jgi:uncharacterized protein (TIGR00369 family)